METKTETRCPASGRTARWCTDQTHASCGAGVAAGIAVDRKLVAEQRRTDGAF